jgi:hypothetical protein
MSIECYNDRCPYHNCHLEKDSGPFCAEDVCVETLREFERIKNNEKERGFEKWVKKEEQQQR